MSLIYSSFSLTNHRRTIFEVVSPDAVEIRKAIVRHLTPHVIMSETLSFDAYTDEKDITYFRYTEMPTMEQIAEIISVLNKVAPV